MFNVATWTVRSSKVFLVDGVEFGRWKVEVRGIVCVRLTDV
jgi:hypothetical protein